MDFTQADILSSFEENAHTNFGSFYNTYYKRFVRYAFYYVNDKQTAEDITHDAILYYWENKDKISANIDILGYILMTVKSKCLNYLKHLNVRTEYNKNFLELHEWEIKTRIMALENNNYSEIFTKEIMEIIIRSLSKLPEQTQYIFIQNRFKYRSRKEIAQEMRVSLQKIDYHINKANDHLYKTLKDYLPILPLLWLFEKIC